MGAILAVFGEPGDPELPVRLERMIAHSPYRGRAERLVAGGAALGVQSLGSDASLGEAGPYVVAFHGWVANWDELARSSRLDARGAANDAERLAVAFEALGEGLFARLRGEFATAILDRRTGVLVVARDVCGVRPLFFHQHGGRTYLASELNQALAGSGAAARLDETFLASTLVMRYGAGEDTLYAGVRRVVPGHVYTFTTGQAGAVPRRSAYWLPPPQARDRGTSEPALAEELRFVLDRAVARALAARPGVVALSGGMDSSTIWALARQRAREGDPRAGLVGAVSLLFPGFECDESSFISEILALTGGEAVSVDAAAVEPFAAIEQLIGVLEDPFVPTLYHGQLIADAARIAGKGVAYYGFGGDEWLTGTPHYLGDELRRGHLIRAMTDAGALLHGTSRERLRKLARFTVVPMTGLPWRRHPAPAWLHPSRRGALLSLPPETAGTRAGKVLQQTLATHRAAGYIGNAELVAARAGVELRCPLHDLDLIEFAFRTPGRAFMGGQRPKHLLRVAMAGLLPASVVERRDKPEFSGPIRRGVSSFARQEEVRSWHLVARNIVAAGEADRIREEVASDRCARGFYDFINLAIAERFCRRFES
ncbi:MAG: asparagine synthase-related protein [Thermoanaerobaculaceae bacterium]|jgi:asparagine synthase (glutamine-hydrolysing)